MVRYRRPGETESLAHHTYRCRAPTRPTPTCPGSICYSDMHNCTITPEQETTLRNAYTELQAQGSYVSGRMLARTAGVSVASALTFLRTHRAETPQEARERQRKPQLEKAYTRLEAQGKEFGSAILAKERAQYSLPPCESITCTGYVEGIFFSHRNQIFQCTNTAPVIG